MDRPEKQCEADEDYDFIGCVKTYTAKIVGCRPGWEDWSSKKYPLWTRIEELRAHEKIDWELNNAEQKIIINETDCKIPCKYRVYSIVEQLSGDADILGLENNK